MSYSCLRHKWTSPLQPCNACSIEQQASYNQSMSARGEEMMRANQQVQNWPQSTFRRLEAERDVAVKLAATYRVALEKVQEALEARRSLDIDAFADTCLQIRRIVNDAGVGPDPSGSDT